MKEQEMFEKLGFIHLEDDRMIAYYATNLTLRIQFYKEENSVDITNHRYSGKLTPEEIKAIEKQCSEIESAQTLDKEV